VLVEMSWGAPLAGEDTVESFATLLSGFRFGSWVWALGLGFVVCREGGMRKTKASKAHWLHLHLADVNCLIAVLITGTLTERYTLLEDGCMCVEADTRVGAKAANSKTVYQRTSSSRDEVLSQSKQRNPSVGAVLQKQRQEGLDA
jgi:hypothetical protein